MSDVFFTDMNVDRSQNLLKKLEKLIDKAGLGTIDFEDKFVAIKIHFGEPGNMAYIRPNYARVVVDYIKERGGKPFLTDCNTLYPGKRRNAIDHLYAAWENGFTETTVGCPVIIADGLKGTDEEFIKINKELVEDAKIGKAIADADIIVSITHFKGHESTGFGGTLKNIGMGSGSYSGKMEQHQEGKPVVIESECIGCKACIQECAHGAITIVNGKARIDLKKCVGCGRCVGRCIRAAIDVPDNSHNDDLCKKIAEYTYATLLNKPNFHISLAMDISPYCDCFSKNHPAILPNVGFFASFDPVAIDVAAADMCNKQHAMKGSKLDGLEHGHEHEHDHFHLLHPSTNWKVQVEHAEKIGLGSTKYKLIEVK